MRPSPGTIFTRAFIDVSRQALPSPEEAARAEAGGRAQRKRRARIVAVSRRRNERDVS